MKSLLLLLNLSIWAAYAFAQPIGFLGKPLPRTVNTTADELAPRFSADGDTLYFVRGNAKAKPQHLYYSTLNENQNWIKGRPINYPNPELYHQNTAAINSAHGPWFLVPFSLGQTKFSLLHAGEKYSIEFPATTAEIQYLSATLSEDGEILIFSIVGIKNNGRIRKDGQLYASKRTGEYTFGNTYLLSDDLNSAGNEHSPCLSPDGQRLYFTSDGLPGHMGGGDIYVSQRNDEGDWGEPIHMGKPVNTKGWDGYFIEHPNGREGYFVSGPVASALGNIYKIDLADIPALKQQSLYQPLKLTELRFQTYRNTPLQLKMPVGLRNRIDVETSIRAQENNRQLRWNSETENEYIRYQPLTGFLGLDTMQIYILGQESPAVRVIIQVGTDTQIAELEPRDGELLLEGTVRVRDEDGIPENVGLHLYEGTRDLGPLTVDETGAFRIRLPTSDQYRIRSNSGFFRPYDEGIAESEGRVETHIVLDRIPVEIGRMFTLNNVYFDLGKSTLRPESKGELEALLAFLKENPNVEIEIRGHTDDQAGQDFNQRLSQDRVLSVQNWLKYRGIMSYRLRGIGFGESQPIVPNDTPENRQRNRRVEFIIISN